MCLYNITHVVFSSMHVDVSGKDNREGIRYDSESEQYTLPIIAEDWPDSFHQRVLTNLFYEQ